MKNLILIVHADLQQSLADLLRGSERVQGFTFTHVEGHGPQDEEDPQLSARDRVVGYTPQVRVDILLEDADVETLLSRLRGGDCGIAGRGRFWITDLAGQGQL